MHVDRHGSAERLRATRNAQGFPEKPAMLMHRAGALCSSMHRCGVLVCSDWGVSVLS